MAQRQKSEERGAAVSEFIAMLAVLVPLFLAVPYIGKVADMNHAAVQASRYGAWERVIAPGDVKSGDAIAAETRRRLFSRDAAPIVTGQVVVNTKAERRALWVDHTGDPMLQKFDDVRITTSENETPGDVAGAVTGAMAKFGQLFEDLPALARPSGSFDVNTRGLVRADVAVNVDGTVLKPLSTGTDCDGKAASRTFVCVRRHNVILSDNWDASAPAQVESRVRALLPSEIFGEPAKLLKVLASDSIPANPFQDFADYEPGIVKPDIVPADRLGAK